MCIARPRTSRSPAMPVSIMRRGDFLAFIDDDETASENWLVGLIETAETTEADAVLGPVQAVYDKRRAALDAPGRFSFDVSGLGRRPKSSPATPAMRFCGLQPPRSPGAASTWRSAAAVAKTPSSSPICTGWAARSPMRRKPGSRSPCRPTAQPLSWLAKRKFRFGQTHGRLIEAGRACGQGAPAGSCRRKERLLRDRRRGRSSFLPFAGTTYILRASLHAGVVSGLLGVREIEQYGAAEARSS